MNTAPAWQHIALADTLSSPWKNGGGTTRELLAWPDPQEWTLRLSVAQVETDGPFSRFEGITRWFAVLAGLGVRLRMAESGQTHTLHTASKPLEFDGAQALDCSLINGPTQDFNLMVRSARHPHSRVRRVAGQMHWQGEASTMLAVWANTAPALLAWSGQAGVTIAPGTLAWAMLTGPTPYPSLAVRGADALFMEIRL